MTRLVITVGPPGSGKSTWAAANFSGLILERDRMREAFWGSRQAYHADESPNKSRIVLGAMLHAAKLWPADSPIAITDTNVFSPPGQLFMRLRAEHTIFVFDTPYKTLLDRNRSRPVQDRVPWAVLDDMFDAFKQPNAWWRSRPHTLITE